MDYEITHRPDKHAIRATGEGEREEEELMGMQIEGATSFHFTPQDDLSESEMDAIVRTILADSEYEHGGGFDEFYYMVADSYQTDEREASYFHVAIEGDKHVALFVKDTTTEESVKRFHQKLKAQTDCEWEGEKAETDLTGTGPRSEEEKEDWKLS